MEPSVIKKAKEIMDWNDRDFLLAFLELLSGFARLVPGGVITKANIEENGDLAHLKETLSYVCMIAKTKPDEIYEKPKSSVDKEHAGDMGLIIKHEHHTKLFKTTLNQKLP